MGGGDDWIRPELSASAPKSLLKKKFPTDRTTEKLLHHLSRVLSCKYGHICCDDGFGSD